MASQIIPREDLEAIDVEARPKGDTEAVRKVLDFLEKLALDKEEGDVEVDLEQQSRGTGTSQALSTFQIRAGEDLADVAQQIVDAAVLDGRDGAAGKVRYRVKAKGHRGSTPFTLTYPECDGDGLDEVPNERGALAQAMTMNADLHRTMIEMLHDVSRTNKAIIAEQAVQIRKHAEIASQNLQMMGDLYTAHHERQLSLVKAERGEKRMDEVAGFLTTAAQVVFNTFLGKKVFASAPTPIEHLTYATMSLFDKEQAQAMITGQPLQLRQEQALGLYKLFEALDQAYKQQKGEQGPAPQAYAPNTSPEASPTAGTTYANGASTELPPPPPQTNGVHTPQDVASMAT
jgi:hypothetical protein